MTLVFLPRAGTTLCDIYFRSPLGHNSSLDKSRSADPLTTLPVIIPLISNPFSFARVYHHPFNRVHSTLFHQNSAQVECQERRDVRSMTKKLVYTGCWGLSCTKIDYRFRKWTGLSFLMCMCVLPTQKNCKQSAHLRPCLASSSAPLHVILVFLSPFLPPSQGPPRLAKKIIRLVLNEMSDSFARPRAPQCIHINPPSPPHSACPLCHSQRLVTCKKRPLVAACLYALKICVCVFV